MHQKIQDAVKQSLDMIYQNIDDKDLLSQIFTLMADIKENEISFSEGFGQLPEFIQDDAVISEALAELGYLLQGTHIMIKQCYHDSELEKNLSSSFQYGYDIRNEIGQYISDDMRFAEVTLMGDE